MASLELDPLFVKALRLLHSKARDSTEQLKQMLDEALHHHTPAAIFGGYDKTDSLSSVKISLGHISKKASSPKHLEAIPTTKKAIKEEEPKKKEIEKRTIDKVKSAADLESCPEPSKKSRLDMTKSITLQSPLPVTLGKEEPLSPDENPSATDIALEMGLACVVCRSFDVTSGNTLVECQDCHSLYHQECHKPPITDQDVNDPRLVWYCAKCTKNMKKIASKNQKSVKPIPPAPTKDGGTTSKNSKLEVVPPPPPTHIFKRAEPKVTSTVASSSTTASTSNKPIGLAGLAASLSGKSHQTQKSSQSSAAKPSVPSKPLVVSTQSSAKVTTTPSSGSGVKIVNSYSNFLMAPKSSSQGSSSTSSSTTTAPTSSTSASISSSSSTFPTSKTSGSGGPSAILASSMSSSKSSSSGNNNGGNGSSTSQISSLLSTKSAGSSSLMSADKRLQIMKKKAAAKMQEKRRLSSK